jgi:hypothetical protein
MVQYVLLIFYRGGEEFAKYQVRQEAGKNIPGQDLEESDGQVGVKDNDPEVQYDFAGQGLRGCTGSLSQCC